MKIPIAFRLSPEAIELLRALAKRLGLSQAGVVELAIRALAREHGEENGKPKKPGARK